MSELSLWKLCQEYSIRHAALLIAGYDPGDFVHRAFADVCQQAKGFIAACTALRNAVEGESIDAVQRHWEQNDFGGSATLDIERTLISVSDLDRFTRAAGLICPIFDRGFPVAEYDAESTFHSKKLHAANRAWEAVSNNSDLLRGKSPKQALQGWLTEHAAELDLLNKVGKPNQTAIEEISKVANWKPEGGATPTPTSAASIRVPAALVPVGSRWAPKESFTADLDDEIPF